MDSITFTRENFDLLLKNKVDQEETIKSLKLSQEILFSICNETPYIVHIIEAIRNSADEKLELKVFKVNCDVKFELEDISKSSKKNIIGDITDLFNENANQQVVEKEYSFIDEKGILRWLSSKKLIFKRTNEGLTEQVLLITKDITENKIASIALDENQHFIKSIADSTPDMLYVIDLETQKIIYINKAIYNLLGYTPDQIINRKGSIINLLFHPKDQEIIKKLFKSFNTKSYHKLADMEYRMKDASGEWHYIQGRHSVFKVDNKGFVTQLLGIGHNVTSLKQFQEDQLSQKLKQQQAISQTILNTQEEERKRIAEALHNSLGQILYGAKLSLSMLDFEKKSTEISNLEIKKIVNDLLEEAIVETKTISFELTPGTLKDFGLETALKDLLNKKFQKTQLKSSLHLIGLKNRIDPDLEITIFRIVQELINNSIKHSHAQNVDLYISKLSDYVYINLTDDGIGFNKELTNDNYKGFGLKNIRNRVMVLNGNFIINTKVNKGTQISIEFPLKAV